jgi:hypothetical protein
MFDMIEQSSRTGIVIFLYAKSIALTTCKKIEVRFFGFASFDFDAKHTSVASSVDRHFYPWPAQVRSSPQQERFADGVDSATSEDKDHRSTLKKMRIEATRETERAREVHRQVRHRSDSRGGSVGC